MQEKNNAKKTEVKQVTSHYEMLSLSHLVNAFMKNTKLDYTSEDFWKMIPIMMREGVAFYVEDGGVPKAYCIIVPINLLNKPGALLFQIYSLHPNLTKILYEHVSKFMCEKNVDKLVALVDPDKVEYFWKNYDAKIKSVLMELELAPQPAEIPDVFAGITEEKKGGEESGEKGKEGQKEGKEVEKLGEEVE
jgi:hypothetical protein